MAFVIDDFEEELSELGELEVFDEELGEELGEELDMLIKQVVSDFFDRKLKYFSFYF